MTKWIDKELLERKVIIQHAAAGEHLPEYAVEKDWWVSHYCINFVHTSNMFENMHKLLCCIPNKLNTLC